MRIITIALLASLLVGFAANLSAASARIVKVLPQFIDLQGRVALNPSLYERDAYQAVLRNSPEKRSGLQFAVQWGSRDTTRAVLRVELRGNRGKLGTTTTIESPVKYRGLFTSWTKVTLTGEAYRNFGELSAWRATLWDGENLLAEQKSFLW